MQLPSLTLYQSLNWYKNMVGYLLDQYKLGYGVHLTGKLTFVHNTCIEFYNFQNDIAFADSIFFKDHRSLTVDEKDAIRGLNQICNIIDLNVILEKKMTCLPECRDFCYDMKAGGEYLMSWFLCTGKLNLSSYFTHKQWTRLLSYVPIW